MMFAKALLFSSFNRELLLCVELQQETAPPALVQLGPEVRVSSPGAAMATAATAKTV